MMNGLLYIQLAQNNFNINSEENIRCCISRYYYGLLHLTIDKLIEIDTKYENLKHNLTNLPSDGYSIHGSAIRDLKEINSAVAADLEIVKKLRVLSDYNFEKTVLNDVEIEFNTKSKGSFRKFKTKDEILVFLNEVYFQINKLKGKSTSSLGMGTLAEAFKIKK
jgi:hypothetical protein